MNRNHDDWNEALRSALFVDFDNIYLGLRQLDEKAAEAFATKPMTWLRWLEAGQDSRSGLHRRFLIRNVYLNPVTFSSYRAVYTRTGFRAIDCPPLTGLGKNSADIYMVLDIVDALQSAFRYDEFVIASTDADFTPVLHRLRGQDRRTTVLTAGLSAAAYRAVCDSFISPEVLADVALGEFEEADTATREDDSPSLMVAPSTAAREMATSAGRSPAKEDVDAVTSAIRAAVAEANKPIVSAAAAQAALAVRPTLKALDWWGAGSFRAFLALYVEDLAYEGNPPPGYVYDPSRHSHDDIPALDRVELDPFLHQICLVTGAPELPSDRYAALFTALAAELAAAPYSRNETSKRVRDRTDLMGASVARNAVNFVIQGLIYAGVKLVPGLSAMELAEAWLANVMGLCASARMELAPGQEESLRNWILGPFPE